MTQLTYQLDDAGNKLWLVADFSNSAAAIKLEQITSTFQESEFTAYFFLEDEAKNAVALINDKVTKKLTSGVSKHVVAEKRPAKIKIKMNADKMIASADVVCAYGGNALTAKQIIRCLAQVGVTMGVDQEAVKALAQKISVGEPGESIVMELAFGKLPVQGEDSFFEALTKNARDRVLQPQEADHGKVDMRDLGEVISVKAGAELMRRHPPTLGKPGFKVNGDTLQPIPGAELPFENAEGVEISSKDKNLLISSMPGLPYVLEKGMRVDNVLMLSAVDISTGHINFEGGVVVNGDVTEGMRLKATGDVTVTGFVDNATIEVAGSLTVAKGIIGRKVDDVGPGESAVYHCHVRAKGVVAAKYMQYANIETQGKVEFHSQLMHCFIKANRVIGVDENKPIGKIVGGFFELEEFLACGTLGAPASTHTHINLYPLYAKLKSKLMAIKKLIHEKEMVVGEIKLAWQHLQKQPDDEHKNELMAETKTNYREHDKLLKQLNLAEAKIETQIHDALIRCKVIATRQMFNNIHVKLGNWQTHTEREYGPLTIAYADESLKKIG
ncbi:DUF342 domain-containing protein [Algibacillus agarilyticus]|uniref:DUF342 domain-containing protein n=1 Tax=Algibacillus agarilyticus TaxID=2234133 RepID=UPI000DD04E86|nr:FapA family protein [Algibacillus agarilyticus]